LDEVLEEGDLVIDPAGQCGIVVGIYGQGYFEVLINKGKKDARILPYRRQDLSPVKQDPSTR